MNKNFSLAILIVGIVLIIFGISVTDSISSDVSNFFTGSPSDKAVWMLVGGTAATITGLVLMLRNTKGI